jgi:hypothetical protein
MTVADLRPSRAEPPAMTEGRLLDEDRIRHVETGWHGFFSFVASGPPPRRLEELLALRRASIVRFAGPELEVAIDNDQFVARSTDVAGEVRARALVEARGCRVPTYWPRLVACGTWSAPRSAG